MRKSSILLVSIFATMFFLTAHIIPAVSAESSQVAQVISKSQQQEFYIGELSQPSESDSSKTPTTYSSERQGLSKLNLAELAVIAPFSPGISLLRVVLRAQEKGANYDMLTLSFFTLVAIFDFLVEKIPGLASFQQIAQHLIIWEIIYLGCQYLGADPWVLWLFIGLGIFTSIVQCVRKVYTLATDSTIVGAPIRSILEDIVAFVMLPL